MVDFIVIFLLIFFTIRGYRIGDTKEMVGLSSMFISTLIAYFPAKGIHRDMSSVGFPDEIGFLTGFYITSLLFYPFIYLFINYLIKDLRSGGFKIPRSKRLLGSAIGFYKAALISVLFLYVLLELPIKSGWIDRSYFISLI
jgi:uncharacterized membrane protein required for colicin V production